MIIFPLAKKKNSTFLLSKPSFIFANQLGYIIKVFYIILHVPFWTIASPANMIINDQVFIFFDCPLIEQAIDFKGFKIINITVNKYREGLMWAELLKKIFEQLKSRLQLHYQENQVDFLIIQDFQSINKVSYHFFNLERVYILLYQFLCNFGKKKDKIAFIKPQHGLVSNFYREKLVFFVVVGFLICKNK